MQQQQGGASKAPKRTMQWRYATAVQAARVLNSTARARRVGEEMAKRTVLRSAPTES